MAKKPETCDLKLSGSTDTIYSGTSDPVWYPRTEIVVIHEQVHPLRFGWLLMVRLNFL